MTTVNTECAAWIGNQLSISQGDFSIPDEYGLASEYLLCSVHERGPSGAYLGRRWYLQEYGLSTRGDLIAIVSPLEAADDGLRCCLDFLEAHGYRCVDRDCGIYSK